MNELVAKVIVMFFLIVFLELLLRRPGLITGGLAEASRDAGARMAGWLVVLIVMFLINTALFLFRALIHIREPRRIPEDVVHYLERMADALMGRYQ